MSAFFTLALVLIYIAAIARTIYEIVFKTSFQPFQKFLWVVLILSTPIIGMLVFYYASGINYPERERKRAVVFILTAIMALIITGFLQGIISMF